MDWKTFIAQIVGSFAWPGVVVFLVLLLRDQISELLLRLIRFKHKDTELEFIERVSELAINGQTKQIADSSKMKNLKEHLLSLAQLHPRSAIIEAYRIVEQAGEKAISKAYPELDEHAIKNQVQLTKMLREKVLGTEQYYQLKELRTLRNNAAHSEKFTLSGEPIETYVDVALSIANDLEKYMQN